MIHKKLFSARVRRSPTIVERVWAPVQKQQGTGVCCRCRKRLPKSELTKAREELKTRSLQRKLSKKKVIEDSVDESGIPSTDSDSGCIVSCSGDDVSSLNLGDSARTLNTIEPVSNESLLSSKAKAKSMHDLSNLRLADQDDVLGSGRHLRSGTHPQTRYSKSINYDSRAYPGIKTLKDLRNYMHSRREQFKDNILRLYGPKRIFTDKNIFKSPTLISEPLKDLTSSAWLKADLNIFVTVFPKGKSFY